VQEGAAHSKSTVKCDALLVDTVSRSDTYPYVDIREDDVEMGHEASVSKISEDQLFYLMSRGMTEDEAAATIVRGFVEPIARELPMEYALELNRLIELQMRGRSAKDDPPGALESGAPCPGCTSGSPTTPRTSRRPPGARKRGGSLRCARLRGLQDDTVLPECHVTAETDPAPQVAASRAERGIVCPSRAAQSAAVRTVRATSVRSHPSLLRQRPRRGVSAPGGA
jgi:SUF system for Fe-S cluster assembly SufBD-like protein